jgi:hypothetical protein
MGHPDALEHLRLAKSQLERVQIAWHDPVDWSDLAMYGFYCLENAVMAAAMVAGYSVKRSHPDKVTAAGRLH